ncbi:MAG: hypothetical protein P1P76_02060 [Anaerolineales bacterium]|nr:hypothetical protein [Anaerolineales bacterium]
MIVAVSVTVGVRVGVGVLVGVGVSVGVADSVGVSVAVAVLLGVIVADGDAVDVGDAKKSAIDVLQLLIRSASRIGGTNRPVARARPNQTLRSLFQPTFTNGSSRARIVGISIHGDKEKKVLLNRGYARGTGLQSNRSTHSPASRILELGRKYVTIKLRSGARRSLRKGIMEVLMTKDLTILLDDQPGALAAMGEALGAAHVNIEGICGFRCGEVGQIHILVENAESAQRALDSAGFKVQEIREVLVKDIVDRPGELGGIARRLAQANINLELLYLTASMALVIGVDDTEKARRVLEI